VLSELGIRERRKAGEKGGGLKTDKTLND